MSKVIIMNAMYRYRAVIYSTEGYNELTYEGKRNTCKQIQSELDNTGNFKLKSLVSIKNLEAAIIVIPFRSQDEMCRFRERVQEGMHPERYEILRIVGRRKNSISKLKKANRNGKVIHQLQRAA